MHRIEIIQGDITQLDVDAIVNTANKSLLGGSGVDGAIHQAAGPLLLRECQTIGGCETGEAKITKGYHLKAKYVIHTVGPIWHGGEYREEDLLARCYNSCLNLAVKNDCKSIAFPAISCGVYGFPIPKAAEIAIHEVSQFLKKNNTLEKVYFICFDQSVYQFYQKALKECLESHYAAPGSAWDIQTDYEKKFEQLKQKEGQKFDQSFKEVRTKKMRENKQEDDKTKSGGGFFKS